MNFEKPRRTRPSRIIINGVVYPGALPPDVRRAVNEALAEGRARVDFR